MLSSQCNECPLLFLNPFALQYTKEISIRFCDVTLKPHDLFYHLRTKFILVTLGEFQSWSVVFDTEYIANQKMVQINAFELSFNLQYQPTLYIAWFSCNLQKFVADFREITPNRAQHAFCLSFLLFKQLQKLFYGTLE